MVTGVGFFMFGLPYGWRNAAGVAGLFDALIAQEYGMAASPKLGFGGNLIRAPAQGGVSNALPSAMIGGAPWMRHSGQKYKRQTPNADLPLIVWPLFIGVTTTLLRVSRPFPECRVRLVVCTRINHRWCHEDNGFLHCGSY